MSLDAIKSISAAEEQARAEKAEAVQNTKKALSDAEKSGAEYLNKAYARVEQEISALMKATQLRAEQNAEELMQNTANKCAAMRVRAESRFDEAASFIVRRVVED